MLDQQYITAASMYTGAPFGAAHQRRSTQPQETAGRTLLHQLGDPADPSRPGPPQVPDYRAYYGELKIRTTIDLPMQEAAQRAITEPPDRTEEPTASLVAIDNETGQVAPWSADRWSTVTRTTSRYPFNLATLVTASPDRRSSRSRSPSRLEHGYTPDSVFDSQPLGLVVPNSGGKEHFSVQNDGNQYSGPINLADATAASDNSVFTQLGLLPGRRHPNHVAGWSGGWGSARRCRATTR